MLKIPYEGSASLTGSNINIRSHVLSGGRPPLTAKVQLSRVGSSLVQLSRVQ